MGGRKQGYRKLKAGNAIIIGEGNSELYYFRHLKSIYGYKCIVKPRFFNKASTSEFRKIIDAHYEECIDIIVVRDMDVISKDDTEKKNWKSLKIRYKNRQNIFFCESMPCIEYWFLMHFTDTCRDLTSTQAEYKLRKHINNYQKTEKFLSNEKWVREMSEERGSLKEAIKRGRKHIGTPSYSKIYMAIEKLERTKD